MNCSHTYVLLLVLTLLYWSSTQLQFMAEGRTSSRLLEAHKMRGEKKFLLRGRIGSRPPSCEGRCRTCGHCEAVQVPALPQAKGGKSHSSSFFTINSRRDDASNYKPLSWKCKCGDVIFNP